MIYIFTIIYNRMYFIIDPVGAVDAGDYRVEVAGPDNSVGSGPVHLSVCPPGE